MALPPAYLKVIVQLASRKRAQLKKLKSMKAGEFGGIVTAKNYPGALNMKRGIKKGKPKLRIV